MAKKKVTTEEPEEIKRLRYQVKRFEDKGLMDTAAHEALARLESEQGLIPARKIEDQKDEVKDGK